MAGFEVTSMSTGPVKREVFTLTMEGLLNAALADLTNFARNGVISLELEGGTTITITCRSTNDLMAIRDAFHAVNASRTA